jgi:magnesium-transporting ATPase (P-type)
MQRMRLTLPARSPPTFTLSLSEAAAAERLRRFGPNRLHPPARPRYARIAVRQVLDPLVALLIAAAAVSALIGESVEALSIAAIVVLNRVLGFVQESAANGLSSHRATAFRARASVIREGQHSRTEDGSSARFPSHPSGGG